jgi:hypothetical protein
MWRTTHVPSTWVLPCSSTPPAHLPTLGIISLPLLLPPPQVRCWQALTVCSSFVREEGEAAAALAGEEEGGSSCSNDTNNDDINYSNEYPNDNQGVPSGAPRGREGLGAAHGCSTMWLASDVVYVDVGNPLTPWLP